jgi:hypothetical protein
MSTASQPSRQPSSQPSSQPSTRPSCQPSSKPSKSPSVQPSVQPWVLPSSQPSKRPTCQPTSQPSTQPSPQPSSQPSTSPNWQPSSQPSKSPSVQPSLQPSNKPTSQPSSQPSNRPTCPPSSSSSSQPTIQPSVAIIGSSSSLSDGLVAYYSFDGNANDKSGNGNNGIMRGGVTMSDDRFGKANKAMNFNTVPNSYIEILEGNSFNFVTNMSIAFWIKPFSSQMDWTAILDKSVRKNASAQLSWGLFQDSNFLNSCQFSYAVSASTHFESNKTTIPSGQWSHYVLVKENCATSVYSNGNLVGKKVSTPPCNIVGNGNLPLVIGGMNYGGTLPASSVINQFKGNLDELYIYNRKLELNEILLLYQEDNATSFSSSQPSGYPSSQPSQLPFSLPSSSPSVPSSFQLSSSPSTIPTQYPTLLLSCHPSICPSVVLTTLPSCFPSVLPSGLPTTFPSVLLTTRPTGVPSVPPSTIPSIFPSFVSTHDPSSQPSNRPTRVPSSKPSVYPSRVSPSHPSSCPSSFPSCFPSVQPTQPFSNPAMHPASFPSTNSDAECPSSQPLSLSNLIPTTFPSIYPFSAPSSSPTSRPSIIPVAFPTLSSNDVLSNKPCSSPSSQPTSVPSSNPSFSPSRQPSSHPSSQPICVPTANPSFQPSSFPTGQPSVDPTSFPSPKSKAPSLSSGVPSPSLSILPSSISSFNNFRQTNFIFGSGQSSNIYPNILLSSNFLSSSISYLLLGSKESLPLEFDITLPNNRHVRSIPLSSSRMSVDTKGGSRSIAFGGDFNHDHRSELIIGDPFSSRVLVLYSNRYNKEWQNVTEGFLLKGNSKNANGLGWAISSAGDFNKDGIDDIVISALYSNKCYLLYGKTSMNISSSSSPPQLMIDDYLPSIGGNINNGMIITIQKDSSILSFGIAIANIGDFNNDNYDDIIISSLGILGKNQIHIVFGSSSSSAGGSHTIIVVNDPVFRARIIRIESPTYSFAGISLSGIKDMNGDGFNDVLIGSIPYMKGYGNQKSYLLYGKSSTSSSSSLRHIFLSNLTKDEGCIIHGGGFLVNGIGDINNDGYDDMIITSYQQWQGKIGSYLITFPTKQQWMSNIPSLLPSSSPTFNPFLYIPSAIPSQESFPSNLPTFIEFSTALLPTSVNNSQTSTVLPTSVNITQSPTLPKTAKPSKMPATSTPSRSPTILASKKPSIIPTRTPTSSSPPSLLPTVSPSTSNRPSLTPTHTCFPSFFPSSSPSLSASSQGKTIVLSEGMMYEGENGAEQIIITSQANIRIKGNQGKKHYIISPSTGKSITITIEDFKSSLDETENAEEGDILDFSQLSSSTFSYSYSTNPLTFHLHSAYDINIILSSHSDYDLRSENVLFPPTSSTSSESSSVSYSSILSTKLLLLMVFIPCAFLITWFIINYRRNRAKKEKGNEKNVDDSVESGKANRLEDDLSDSLGSSFLSSNTKHENGKESVVDDIHTNRSNSEPAVEDGTDATNVREETSDAMSSFCSSLFDDFEGEKELNQEEDPYSQQNV